MRIACESAFRDSNTLSPSQIGQASRRLMSSTRSFGVRGPGVTRRPDGQQTSDHQHQQHPTRPALQRRPRHPYAWRSCCSSRRQRLRRDRRGVPHDDDPGRVDDPRLGNLCDAERRGDRAVVVLHDRPVAAVLVEPLGDGVVGIVLDHRVQLGAVGDRRPAARRTRPARDARPCTAGRSTGRS